jgi:methionine synthase I (cobalamin-dependent)
MGSLQRLLLLGEVNERSVTEAYRAQALALAESGVDGLICRRFREMEALRLAARAAATTQLPLVACMTFDCGAEFMETSMGASVAQACEILREVGAAVIGCDGGENPDALPALVAEMQKHWQGPIWASTDAGTPLLTDGKLTYSDKPANFAARLPALRAAGANFVGGGRGATTDHIAALAAAGKSRK